MEVLTGRCFEGKISIQISNRTGSCTFDSDRGTDNGFIGFLVQHDTGYMSDRRLFLFNGEHDDIILRHFVGDAGSFEQLLERLLQGGLIKREGDEVIQPCEIIVVEEMVIALLLNHRQHLPYRLVGYFQRHHLRLDGQQRQEH